MYLKKGDQVVITTGKDKDKQGTILSIINKNKVIVENINLVKKHAKPTATNSEGGIIEKEMPIDASNVMLIDPKTKKPTRVKFEIKNNKKIRLSVKSNQEV